MAVYKKTYRRYEGPLTVTWSRFLVIPRYAFEDMRRSRFLTIFYLASYLWPLGSAVFIYINHNLSVLKLLGVPSTQVLSIGAPLFMTCLGMQSMLAFFLAAFIGPGLVSPDLSNNALPLYLARPFSRTEYVLGKASVLVILLSLMTWVPGLLLYGLQSYMEGGSWYRENLRLASGVFFGSWIWIMLLTLLALALSAWVKWKPAAGALMFGTFFVAAGFGAAINAVMRTRWGNLINLGYLIGSIWNDLFAEPMGRRTGAVFFRVDGPAVPVWCCWLALASVCLFCLYLLNRKIRGAEVVR